MIRFPSKLLSVIVALACFLDATLSFSTPSSSSSPSIPIVNNDDGSGNDNGNEIANLMEQTSTAETEKLAHYYDAESTITNQPTVWLSSEEASAYIRDHIDTVLFDCDGVLYRTQSPCPGASECIRQLMHTLQKRVLFVTNNAGVNRRELCEKLSKILGMDSLTTDQMISSSYSSAQYLKNQLLVEDSHQSGSKSSKPRVHVIGSSGLVEELAIAGFDVTGGPSLPNNEPGSMSRDELENYDFENGNDTNLHPIDALVVGHDTDLNFRKLCIADNLLLRNPNAKFVATNRDSFDVVDGNSADPTTRHILGNGATVVALEYSSNRKAINVGKPSQELFALIQEEEEQQQGTSGLGDPSRCLFVGDRLDTDIKFGKDNGMKSLLVMTGVTSAQTIQDLGNGSDTEPLPDFILPYVGMLVEEQNE